MTQIIATIGPATYFPDKIEALYSSGVAIFRLNFSHGEHAWHKTAIDMIRKHAPHAKIMLDTKGPEVRTGDLKKPLSVKKDDILTFVTKEENQNITEKKIFVNHAGLPNDIATGDLIMVNSGKIGLEVLEKNADEIQMRVQHDGIIRSRRHVNLVEKDVSLPTLTDHDILDIQFGLENGVDILALSFIRKAEGVLMVKKMIEKVGRSGEVLIASKIESRLALNNLEEIAEVSDMLMVARGDLGVETPLEEVPYRQIDILKIAKKNNIQTIVATEMLESMTRTSRPTRAEVSDISLAVWQGANYTMLSGETAAGKYPVESVQYMQSIILSAEKNTKYSQLFKI